MPTSYVKEQIEKKGMRRIAVTLSRVSRDSDFKASF